MSTGAITFFDLELKQLSGPKPILLNDYIPDVLKKNAKDVESKLDNKDGNFLFLNQFAIILNVLQKKLNFQE